MEEDKGGGVVGVTTSSSARFSATLALPAPPPALSLPPVTQPSAAPSNPHPCSSKGVRGGTSSNDRQMFPVELKQGETTIVSWKKLLREASKVTRKNYLLGSTSVGTHDSGTAAAVPDSHYAPPSLSVQPSDGNVQNAPPSNRFSAVIEKIERLYMGKQSSDEEELDDIPDDDQYDTEDSFIDDAELDEYFQVDKLSTKHNGYFVNRGKLERTETSSPNLAPNKRRRKDSRKDTEGKNEHIIADVTSTGNLRMKAAARTAPSMGKNLTSLPDQNVFEEHYQEEKLSKKNLGASTGTCKKSADSDTNLLNPSSVRILKNFSSSPFESKDHDKHKAGVGMSVDISNKSKMPNESSYFLHHASRDTSVRSQVESQYKSLGGEIEVEVSNKVRRKERYGTDGFPFIDSVASACTLQSAQASDRQAKECSSVRPKGTYLERAIRDLEKIVALCRPHKLDLVEVDASSQTVKRRLPQEVKQKLAKVARLSVSQNKISEDLIDRLMGIVGHIVQRRTLKRNMREMVELGLSAKEEKADRVQQIEHEVNEMIKTRVLLLKAKAAEQQDGSANDFQEANGNDERRSRKYGLDIGMEDKICELYDLYVEGIDGDKGPRSKKLYAEIAELWPNGYMDSNGIKDAISRSRERKRSRIYKYKVRDEERLKRKRLASTIKEESSLGVPLHSRQEQPTEDSTISQVLVSQENVRMAQPISLSVRVLEQSPPSTHSAHEHGSVQYDKINMCTSTAPDNGTKTAPTDVKQNIKRKPEFDIQQNSPYHHGKLTSYHGKERTSALKHGYETNASHQSKPAVQLPASPMPSNPQNPSC